MAVNSDPLVVFRFIGDVVEMFEPSLSMSLYFDDKNVTNGSDVKPSLAASAPLVTIGGEPGKFYTLVMIDPDDPSPREPTLREWAHWQRNSELHASSSTSGHPSSLYSDPVSAGGTTRFSGSGTANHAFMLLN